jgi:hypothetical protein
VTKPRPITPQELEAIKKSVGMAKARLLNQTTLIAKLRKVLHPKQGQTEEQNLAERALLWLEVGQNRDLREPSYASVIDAAVKRNDHRFFVRLGKNLSRKPYTMESLMANEPQRKIESFLVRYWATKRNDLPELFYLTPTGLADAVYVHVGVRVTEDSLVKMRQRLGLEAFKRAKVHVKIIGKVLKCTD